MRGVRLKVTYLIASSKPWHKEITKSQDLFFQDHFVWVSDKNELTLRLEELSDVRYIFFLHWNWLVPDAIWERYECVCFHMTDVPYGQGGSPLQNLIVRGHTDTKLTALRMVAAMDAGPVYTKRMLSLEGTALEIFVRAGHLSYEIMQWLIEKEPKPLDQEGESEVFQRRKPEQSRLPIIGSLSNVYDHIRMLDAPTYPKAFIEHGDFILEFTGAVLDCEELTANVRFRKK